MDIARNLQEVRERIARAASRAQRSPDEITLIAVTKGLSSYAVQAAIEAGIDNIGENRVQEAAIKVSELQSSGLKPVWHMIGHLQRNKVKTAVDIFDIIHSVDSLRLAMELNERTKRVMPVMLQVNVSQEHTKGGFAVAEVPDVVSSLRQLTRLEVTGLMTIAPLMSDPVETRPIFRSLRQLRDTTGLRHLSMGMSDDFEVAIEEGATMVRIGRAIFGG